MNLKKFVELEYDDTSIWADDMFYSGRRDMLSIVLNLFEVGFPPDHIKLFLKHFAESIDKNSPYWWGRMDVCNVLIEVMEVYELPKPIKKA